MASIYFIKTVMHHCGWAYQLTPKKTADINNTRMAKPDNESYVLN